MSLPRVLPRCPPAAHRRPAVLPPLGRGRGGRGVAGEQPGGCLPGRGCSPRAGRGGGGGLGAAAAGSRLQPLGALPRRAPPSPKFAWEPRVTWALLGASPRLLGPLCWKPRSHAETLGCGSPAPPPVRLRLKRKGEKSLAVLCLHLSFLFLCSSPRLRTCMLVFSPFYPNLQLSCKEVGFLAKGVSSLGDVIFCFGRKDA